MDTPEPVGTQHHGHTLRDQSLSRGGRLIVGRCVIGVHQLDLVLLAADGDGGDHLVGVLHTQDLLLAACAVITGLRLKHADLNDLVAGSGIIALLTVALLTAGHQRESHDQRQHHC